MFKYQIEGRWRTEFVSKEEIRKLLIKGTLTPYCFIQDSGVGSQKSMICKHPDFEASAHTDWAKLRKVRSLFNQLWKGQLDAIMSGIVERVGPNQSSFPIGGEQITQDIREKINDVDFIPLINEFCRNEESVGLFNNEIKRRTTVGFPKFINNLPFSEEGHHLDSITYENKIQTVSDEINNLGPIPPVVYAFLSHEKVIYVGQANVLIERFFGNGIATRSGGHFFAKHGKGRKFCHECTSIAVYRVNGNIDSVYGLDNFESLMIHHHGTPCNNEKPKYNESPGRNIIQGPIHKYQTFISKEVDELKT